MLLVDKRKAHCNYEVTYQGSGAVNDTSSNMARMAFVISMRTSVEGLGERLY